MSDRGPSKRLLNGLYDRLVYSDEVAQIDRFVQAKRALVSEPSIIQRREHLVDEIASRIPELLDEVTSSQEDTAEQARLELRFIAHMLREARARARTSPDTSEPAEPLRVLKVVHAPNAPPQLPQTGLRRPWIFTSARSDPSLLAELRAELSAADHVDILVSFITWSGVRKILDVLKQVSLFAAKAPPVFGLMAPL